LAVSRAGDWTARFIDDPPRSVWVRGAPVAGIANVRTLFTRVVFVATGSGIGPTFGHLLAGDAEVHLVWVTRDPRRTYGDAFVDEILAAAPGATIWNTDTHGKPDVFALAHEAYVSTRAQAVICISNRAVTRRVVHGLERLGVPAFGPIWDS
jgi:ferredoxin-NADP reductase